MLRLNTFMSALPLVVALSGCGAKTGLREPDPTTEDVPTVFDASVVDRDAFVKVDSGMDTHPISDAAVVDDVSDVAVSPDREEPHCTTSSDGPMCTDLVDTILRNDPVAHLRTMMLDGHRVLPQFETDRVEASLRREYPHFPSRLTPFDLEVWNRAGTELIPWRPHGVVSYLRQGLVLFVLVSDTHINGMVDLSRTALLLYHVRPSTTFQ